MARMLMEGAKNAEKFEAQAFEEARELRASFLGGLREAMMIEC